MTEASDSRPTVTQFTDPMCTWCWGSEPIIRRLRVAFGNQIRIRYVMGGLIEDFDGFYDAANDISEPSDVGGHWLDASDHHGMPVDTDIFDVDPARSTYPASIAYVAARQQDEQLANRYLRRLREAFATQVKNTNRRDVQIELAEAVGLNIDVFTAALEDGSARSEFEADLSRTRNAGVRAFPTYRIEGQDGQRQLPGFQSFDDIVDALMRVEPSLTQSSPPSIERFVSEYGPVATQEVAELYELSHARAYQTLQALSDDGVLHAEERGNGYFWHAAGTDRA